MEDSFHIQSGNLASFDGTQIHYVLTQPKSVRPGQRLPVLVFCNGAGMDAALWKYLLEYFRPKMPTLTWDYRGHGLSQKPKNFKHLKIDDFCQDLLAIFEEVKIYEAILVGHSMGVQVILEFAHLGGDRIKGLIGICGSSGDPLATLFHTSLFSLVFPGVFSVATKNAFLVNPLWKMWAQSRIGEEVMMLLASNRFMIDREDFHLFMQNVRKLDLEFYFYLLKSLRRHAPRKIIKSIDLPVLLIAGERDLLTPVRVMQKLGASLSQANLFVVPHGSHLSLLDQPELINLKVEAFLETLFARRNETVAEVEGRIISG